MDWIDEIASDDVLRQAYDWLCERRVDYSPNDDVWDVRWRWEEIRPALKDALRAGDYRMSSVRRFSSGGFQTPTFRSIHSGWGIPDTHLRIHSPADRSLRANPKPPPLSNSWRVANAPRRWVSGIPAA